MAETDPPPFDSKSLLAQLTMQPGVYRMYGADDELLYVGKARQLKKRVASYFMRASGNPRVEAMVAQIRRFEVSVTNTEDEALLLEATLIKELEPRYNVMLRDDKSYPYVRISQHAYPRISFYRGARVPGDQYFGPFPSSHSVRETLVTLQKLFNLRPCTDQYFSHRQRPCLQHQIGRCSAPCVGLIDAPAYAAEVRNATRLLEGRGDELAAELGERMEQASEALDFEQAARLRDQIAALNRLRGQRDLTGGAKTLDVIAIAAHAANSCIVVITVRDGMNFGHGSFFPKHPPNTPPNEILGGFMGQYYLQRTAPGEILVSQEPDDCDWLAETLAHRAGHKVRIFDAPRLGRRRLLDMARATADQALSSRLTQTASMSARLSELADALGLQAPPVRLECFDISHTRGERAVASCVVFNEEGALKSAYRKFNIEGITPGDDYAAIHQAVARRYARIKGGEYPIPDVLFIDGGKGQVTAACTALQEVGIDGLLVVGIAKGITRRPGLEQLIVAGREEPLILAPDSIALHLVQSIRDEAHRFAITGHRARREKARLSSGLEVIEGLGPSRRRALLKAMGGVQQVKRAGVDDLAKVPGISRRLAERIYAHFH